MTAEYTRNKSSRTNNQLPMAFPFMCRHNSPSCSQELTGKMSAIRAKNSTKLLVESAISGPCLKMEQLAVQASHEHQKIAVKLIFVVIEKARTRHLSLVWCKHVVS